MGGLCCVKRGACRVFNDYSDVTWSKCEFSVCDCVFENDVGGGAALVGSIRGRLIGAR